MRQLDDGDKEIISTLLNIAGTVLVMWTLDPSFRMEVRRARSDVARFFARLVPRDDVPPEHMVSEMMNEARSILENPEADDGTG